MITCPSWIDIDPATLERNNMTEALKKDYQKTCAERIQEQWKLRQRDLRNNEFEPLGFDYVEPHTLSLIHI